MNILNNMTAQETLKLAEKHAFNRAAVQPESAKFALKEAASCWRNYMATGDMDMLKCAKKRAVDSLKYSIGILHSEFPR